MSATQAALSSLTLSIRLDEDVALLLDSFEGLLRCAQVRCPCAPPSLALTLAHR